MMLNRVLNKNMLLSGACRNFHVMTKSATINLVNEEPVPLYEGPGAADMKKMSEDHQFVTKMIASEHRSKCFSLLAFFAEARFTPKSFVTKMELYPESETLKLEVLTMDGIVTKLVPIDHFIPITKYDYWASARMLWTK